MTLPALADVAADNPDWRVFLVSSLVTFFVGAMLALSFRLRRFRLTIKETFLMTTASWVLVCAFASLPFVFSTLGMSPADAYFEAMSGLTTTGSTVIEGLDNQPPGILLWRSLLQWLGGIGIVAMAVAILPILRVGGMQLFRTESSSQSEGGLPRAAKLAASIVILYVALTAIWIVALYVAGMSGFDAICHGMTTIATGGFSTSDQSIRYFNSVAVDCVVIVGMVVGSLPFVLYLKALRGDAPALWRDSQVQWFFGTLAVMIIVLILWQWFTFEDRSLFDALRYGAFNVVSVMTGTGYATDDYAHWGALAVTVMFFLMFVGGCTGGTTGGIKVFRYQVLFSAVRVQFVHLLRPHAVFVPHFDGRPVPNHVVSSVLGFFFMFFAVFAVTALGLALHGYDFVTSISGAATAVANVGPALGPIIGPAGTFASLDDSAKWLLSAAMLLGRLELFTVMILFMPGFWRA